MLGWPTVLCLGIHDDQVTSSHPPNGEDLDLTELGGQIAWVEPELMERVVGGWVSGIVGWVKRWKVAAFFKERSGSFFWGELTANKGGEEWLAQNILLNLFLFNDDVLIIDCRFICVDAYIYRILDLFKDMMQLILDTSLFTEKVQLSWM